MRRDFLIARLPRPGLRFRVKTEDVVGRHIYKYQVHEPELTSILLSTLAIGPDDVVIDIGANIGWYSILLDKIAPIGADIYAFEPDPLNFELLGDNLHINDARKVHPFRLAVAEEEGVMKLYRYDANNLGRHSLLELQTGSAVDVQTTTLDRFWVEQGLGDRTPRFIKIDIEGYELHALRGARAVLERCPTVLCEFSPEYMRTGGIEPVDLVNLLAGQGFEPHRITAGGLERIDRAMVERLEGITDLWWQKPIT